jgi:formamidopyrimidine-DNA glycosylase
MPELPEVETSRRGIAPWILGTTIKKVIVRDRRLRWPVAKGVERKLQGRAIEAVERRAKYLLIRTSGDTIILHLGMTGSVFIVDQGAPAGIHDHLDFELESGKVLRFRDPRRFGSFHLCKDPLAHPLLGHQSQACCRANGPPPLRRTG